MWRTTVTLSATLFVVVRTSPTVALRAQDDKPQDGDVVAVLAGHGGPVTCVAFTRDGETLAFACRDKTVRLWNVSRRKEVRTLMGHGASVGSLAFSPDGKRIAGAGGPKAYDVLLWDVRTGMTLRTLVGHNGPVTSLAWSPDDKTLVSAGPEEGFWVWELAKAKELSHIEPGGVLCVAFGLGGKILAAGNEDGLVELWNVANWRKRQTLRGHSARVTSIVVAGDGKTLASGSADETVNVWDIDSETRTAQLKVGEVTRALAISKEGKWLACGYADGAVKIWDVATKKELRTLLGHTEFISAVAFSPDGRTLASASHDGNVRLWNLEKLMGK
jgi:WD40 repeat protein